MKTAQTYEAIRNHLRLFFAGHRLEEQTWRVGPTWKVLSRFHVLEISPGPQCSNWVYASVGTWESLPQDQLEFLIVAPYADLKHVELLTMAAWYHRTEKLGLGHTFPLGESWLPESSLEYMLVALPYPFGPLLELCPIPQGHLHIYWLLPITKRESEFRRKEGQEALERKFDEAAIEYWNPQRSSVV